MQYYVEMWTRYFDFSGRTSRRGYWMAVLFNILASIVVGLLASILHISALTTIYTAATLIPGLALVIRRLRDAGKHWAWYFINFVPLVGQIVILVFLCQPSVAQPEPPTQWANDEYNY